MWPAAGPADPGWSHTRTRMIIIVFALEYPGKIRPPFELFLSPSPWHDNTARLGAPARVLRGGSSLA